MLKRTSARRAATFLAALGALVMSSGVALMVAATPAHAAAVADCVPKDAYTETIDHPAVTHVVHHPAVEAVPSRWWNWSPNKQQGPFNGPPAFPTDSRGTWQGPHTNGGPGKNLTGTFHQGKGHGSWFHREAAVPGHDAYDEVVVDQAAYTETINHPAVTCDNETPPTTTTAGVTFIEPTCTSAASYTTLNNQGVSYALTGTVGAGQQVTVTASAAKGYTITNDTVYNHTFTTPANCSVVTPPVVSVSPPKSTVKSHTETKAKAETSAVTPTVVEAGLTSVSTKDLRGEQGLALMVSGMVMLAAAGGLGLRLRGAASRI